MTPWLQIDGHNIVGECENCESHGTGLVVVAMIICS